MSEFRKLPTIGLAVALSLGTAACGGEPAHNKHVATDPSQVQDTTYGENKNILIKYYSDGTREIVFHNIPSTQVTTNIFEFCVDHAFYSETEGETEDAGASANNRTDRQAVKACADNKLTPSDFITYKK